MRGPSLGQHAPFPFIFGPLSKMPISGTKQYEYINISSLNIQIVVWEVCFSNLNSVQIVRISQG